MAFALALEKYPILAMFKIGPVEMVGTHLPPDYRQKTYIVLLARIFQVLTICSVSRRFFFFSF